jgi:hypothetical protein
LQESLNVLGHIAPTGADLPLAASGLGAAEWAGITGAGFAAVAAVAALWTAFQNRAWLKTALRPVLSATGATITDPTSTKALPHPQLHIANAGGGVARHVMFIWTAVCWWSPFMENGRSLPLAWSLAPECCS